MAEEHSAQEKTEQATQKRKTDARKKGEVLRSRELTIFLSLMAAGGGILALGPQIIEDLKTLLTDRLALSRSAAFSNFGVTNAMNETIGDFSLMLFPFFALMLISMVSAQILLGGVTMNFGLLAPKGERISILKGFGRIFSVNGLVELIKAIAKCTLVGATVVFVIGIFLDDILTLSVRPIFSSLSMVGNIFTWSFFGFSAVLVLVAAIDVPFQISSFSKKLKMTKQEIKDEMKETEGRPEVKSAIRAKQQEVAQQRMMSAVPTADVVITNPTHYAVAIKYEEAGNSAPVVIAKGRDLVAANIREVAGKNDIPLFSAPPLARALYSSTEINQQIPENLFLAVAQVLAYVFQLRDAVGARRKPKPPTNLPVPEEYELAFPRRAE